MGPSVKKPEGTVAVVKEEWDPPRWESEETVMVVTMVVWWKEVMVKWWR